MTALASDLFTGADDTWINNHVPDSGFTSWVEGMNGPNALFIKSNKLKCTAGFNFGRDHVLAFPALTDDNFEYRASVVPAGNSAYAGLRFRCDDQIKTAWNDGATKSDFMAARLVLSSGPTLVGFQVVRSQDSVQQESYTVESGVNLSDLYTAGIDLGVTVTGPRVQVWTEPYGGGTRTNRGAPQTMLVTYLDGLHKQFGLWRSGNGEIGTTWENLTLEEIVVGAIAATTQQAVAALTGEQYFIGGAIAATTQQAVASLIGRVVPDWEGDALTPGTVWEEGALTPGTVWESA